MAFVGKIWQRALLWKWAKDVARHLFANSPSYSQIQSRGKLKPKGLVFFPWPPCEKKLKKNSLTEIPLANASQQMEKECKANPCCLESLFNSSPAAKITQTAHLAHPQLILLQDSAVTQDEHKLFGHHTVVRQLESIWMRRKGSIGQFHFLLYPAAAFHTSQ